MKVFHDTFVDAVESYPTLQKSEATYGDELRAREMGRSYLRLGFFDRVYLPQMERLKVRRSILTTEASTA
jgi:hypothetical protein